MLELREVAHGSPEQAQVVELRRTVLRLPLGLDFTPGELSAERDDVHLGAFDGGEAVGCLVLTPEPEGRMRMRQVGVLPERQGEGIGRSMVLWSERRARRAGAFEMVLHARATVVPFYLALGYEPFGPPFEEVTIPHQAMRKSL